MSDRLDEYRRKRDARRTPEPVPPTPPVHGAGNTFVVQQHHARALHWDLRLERDGVLASWAVPRGIPRDPRRDHLAVQTEDHPMEYAEFSGSIPEGEYGAGTMRIYDRGTFVTEKWLDDEVIVVFSGEKVTGRYVLFHTRGKDWMIHRMDPLPPGWTPVPEGLRPMLASPATRLPRDGWAYELEWPGQRLLVPVTGGRLGDGTDAFGELRALGETLAPVECVLDGVVVAFDPSGQVSRDALAPRLAATTPAAKRRAARVPIQFMVFDLLWLDGVSTVDEPYARRRELLDGLGLTGDHWQTPPVFPDGASARAASAAHGMAGVVAKRLDSAYEPGAESKAWRRVPNPG